MAFRPSIDFREIPEATVIQGGVLSRSIGGKNQQKATKINEQDFLWIIIKLRLKNKHANRFWEGRFEWDSTGVTIRHHFRPNSKSVRLDL